jgi:hypothetical protein
MKHNKNASKGENTFAGKIKKLKELNLREAELNAFDIGTCEGMRQVADISNASIIKQLHQEFRQGAVSIRQAVHGALGISYRIA